jgi:hypothetical protein
MYFKKKAAAAGGGGTGNITYFASASAPADNGSDVGPTNTITPPGSMAEGDLVVVICNYREFNVDRNITVAVDGGQAWTSETIIRNAASEVQTARLFWCRYDGTWDANPQFTVTTGTSNFTATMHVFRSSVSSNTWAVDVAQVAAGYAAPSTPFDVTITGISTNTDGAIVIAYWCGASLNTWTLQTGGWANAGTVQYRNNTPSNQSASTAYKVMASHGASGDVVNRQNTLQDDGATIIIAFKAVP